MRKSFAEDKGRVISEYAGGQLIVFTPSNMDTIGVDFKDGTATVQAPWYFRNAPTEVKSDIVRCALCTAYTGDETMFGFVTKEYMSSSAFLDGVMAELEKMPPYSNCRLIKKDQFLSAVLSDTKRLLSNVPEVHAARALWCEFNTDMPYITMNPLAKTVFVDMRLSSKDVPLGLVRYAVFHELCRMAAYLYEKNRYIESLPPLYLKRMRDADECREECRRRGWVFAKEISDAQE